MRNFLYLLILSGLICSCGRVELSSTPHHYEVGDIYNKDGKEGIVFLVTDDGLHGKIVSRSIMQCEWSYETLDTYVYSENDGTANMEKIQQISGWHDKYPAFAFCADEGEGWYLPAKNELKVIYESGVLLDYSSYWSLDYSSYWSSTEGDKWHTWSVNMSDGSESYDHKTLGSVNYVCAVSRF